MNEPVTTANPLTLRQRLRNEMNSIEAELAQTIERISHLRGRKKAYEDLIVVADAVGHALDAAPAAAPASTDAAPAVTDAAPAQTETAAAPATAEAPAPPPAPASSAAAQSPGT